MRRSSLDLPGGSVQTEGGEILLRTKGQAYRGADFEGILLRSRRDGTQLWLRDVAQVVDGFAETDTEGLFDGMPSVLIQVFFCLCFRPLFARILISSSNALIRL